MLCPNCNRVVLGVCCHDCGTCEVATKQAVGFNPFNPIDVGYWLAGKEPKPTIDPFNPVEVGGAAGRAAGPTLGEVGSGMLGGATGSVAKPFSDFFKTLKWVAIGGAALAGTVILYSVYQAWHKDLPGRSLEAFKAGEAQKVALASKFLPGAR